MIVFKSARQPAVGRTGHRGPRPPWLPASILIVALCSIATLHGDSIPTEFHGEWAAKGDCRASLRLRVEAERITLVNGSDAASYDDIGWPTTFFGPDYDGISRVAIPELESMDSPFTLFFNWEEHRGVARVDIFQSADIPGNVRYNQIMAAARQLSARFPFGGVDLRKCQARRVPAAR
jgi:hypothetical protein